MRKLLLLIPLLASLMICNKTNAQIVFLVEDPPSLVGSYSFTYGDLPAGWGVDMSTAAVLDTLVVIDDGTTADSLGCNPAVNGAQIASNIAVVYRGACEFGLKALQAQNAGAVAVIIINNIPGGPVGMAPGTSGASVTIPVIMISQDDGALLRASIDTGGVVGFIGNKTGFYNNDFGFYNKDIVMAHSFAIPKRMAQNSTDFNIPVGAWIYNFGVNNQSDVQLTAEVILGNDTLYSETSATGTSLNSGDSVFISLPVFSKTSYDSGYYSLTYSTSAVAADDFLFDNKIVTNFWINDNRYSKSRINPVTLEPINTSSYRSTGGPAMTWCIVIDTVDVAGLTIKSLTFSASTRTPASLIDRSVIAEIYKWNADIAGPFDDIVQLQDKYYDYTANLQNVFVTAQFNTGIPLDMNERYLACLSIEDDSLFIGTDEGLDYNLNQNLYDNALFPLNSGQWFGGGFGSGYVPAIVVNFDAPVGIEKNKLKAQAIKAFPNPANYTISIPLSAGYNGKVELQVFDITGKLVKADVITMSNTNLFNVNTSSLENGSYFFQLKFEDQSISSFPVVITH